MSRKQPTVSVTSWKKEKTDDLTETATSDVFSLHNARQSPMIQPKITDGKHVLVTNMKQPKQVVVRQIVRPMSTAGLDKRGLKTPDVKDKKHKT
jgi:hypothetical protein